MCSLKKPLIKILLHQKLIEIAGKEVVSQSKTF